MKNLYSFLLTLCAVLFANTLLSQTISTFAGNGIGGFSGDGGPATAASLQAPRGLAVDRHGNVYISDIVNNKIRKVDIAGIITTIAGNDTASYLGDGGPATAARLSQPNFLQFDSTGNLFIGDSYRVRKIDTMGIISTYAGGGIGTYSGDGGPATAAGLLVTGLAFDDQYNLYMGGIYSYRVRKVNASGIITTFAGTGIDGSSGDGGPATNATMYRPFGITTDPKGNVYIVDHFAAKIKKVDTAGIITNFAGTGIYGYSGDGGPATAARITHCNAVNSDRFGNIYFGDYFNDRVRMIDTNGIINTIAGSGISGFSGDGGAPGTAQLLRPSSVVIDHLGRIFIADEANHRVRVITPPNSTPYFTRGHTQNITVCTEFATVGSLLPVMDTDMAQSLSWSLVTAPAHGTAIASYTAITTGGVLMPTGTTYIPSFGYKGPDTFAVRVSDGLAADTTVICVSVIACPLYTPPLTGATENNNLMVFPNPAKDALTVRYTSRATQDVSIVITNTIGELVCLQSGKTNSAIQITIATQPGVYFLSAATDGEQPIKKKVIIGY